MRPFPRPCLMLVTEPSPRLPQIVSEAIAGGVDIVQWRDKSAAIDTLDVAWSVLEAIAEQALMIVNGQPNYSPYLVRKISTDGVHLPENSLYSPDRVRPALAGGLAGCSVHSVAKARQAASEGADYLVAGTIFASQSHPDLAPAGLGFLREVCAAVSIPVLAIGGVTPENAGACLEAGAAGVAVLSPIMRAADPKSAAQEFRMALDEAWEKLAPSPNSGGVGEMA